MNTKPKVTPGTIARHGTTYGYKIGCRCEPCRAREHLGYLRRPSTLSLSLGNTNEAATLRFSSAFGGSVHEDQKKWHVGYKTQWKWRCTGSNAKWALAIMLPYLFVKKGEAFEALKISVASSNDQRYSQDDLAYRRTIADRVTAMKKAQ